MNTWFLVYIATLSTGGGMYQYEYKMPSIETCLETVKAAKVEIPSGGDAESTVAIFCANSTGDRK